MDNGATWKNDFLPGTTQFVSGPYTRVSDPSVAYDLAGKTWIISSIAVFGNGSSLTSPTIIVNLSTNGGLTWGVSQTSLDKAHGLGGQPLVQPNGTVIVPISGYATSRMLSFTSTNGGLSWNSTIEVTKITGSVLPTAGIDAAGKVYLVWVDCQFEKGCSGKGGAEDAILNNASQSEDDLVMSTSEDGIHWPPVHFAPIAGPMPLTWLSQGRNKVGDYISTFFCGGLAFPFFSIAAAPRDGYLKEAMYTISGGLVV